MTKGNNVQPVSRNKADAIDEEADRRSDQDAASESEGARASREDRIRLAAYAAAERRGFAPGFETDDWLEAEQQVDAQDPENPSP
ncbi:DUF2934 domain-containing protein [Variovorax robiniae]|uniref:DUF2934 domain-containing protein n=1 Tax=Variovorax robiniae TaxID=1836199 RepID=A0ABU8XHU9_9BURK